MQTEVDPDKTSIGKPQSGGLSLFLRFLAEIVVIFVGITISFMFDQWREEQDLQLKRREMVEALITDLKLKKEEFVHDTPACKVWIDRLDSIQLSRLNGSTPDAQIRWFWEVMARGDIFFFSPETEAYRSAQNTVVYQTFPDSVRRAIHGVFQERFAFNQIIYQETKNTITQFRNNVVIPSGYLENMDDAGSNDKLGLLRLEMKKPAYGNFINEIILQEGKLADYNRKSEKAVDALILQLNRYLASLE